MSDYQAIYDAVRSRISNGDVGSVIERVASNAFDISYSRLAVQDAFCAAAWEAQRPSVLFRPTVGLDGNMYSVLYGEDLMNGCAGFGKTMAEAMADFDKNWMQQQAPNCVTKRETP